MTPRERTALRMWAIAAIIAAVVAVISFVNQVWEWVKTW